MSGQQGMVTASSSAAAEAGAEVLRKGGNAVDAAVATALASCVADPCNTGLGGYGGHLVVAGAGEPMCVDFNTWIRPGAPVPPQGLEFGWPVVAIPNVVAGLATALRRFGTKSWHEVSEPAHRLAESGVDSNETTKLAFADVANEPFVEECFRFADGEVSRARDGFRFQQPALARTLEQLAVRGPEWFYGGPIGDAACKLLQASGQTLSRADWGEVPDAVTVEPAAQYEIAGATLFSAPLGTSGSASLFATIAAGHAVAARHPSETAAAVSDWAQYLASIWSYRFGVPEGNDFSHGGIDEWVERALAFKQRVDVPRSVGHTCHLNVAAPDGSMAAVTLTHGPSWFGARCAIPDTGIIMNAGMRLFSAAAPVVKHGRAYAVTNMAPTIAKLPGASIAIGCPGARRIPTIIGLALVRHLFRGLSLQDAVSAARFHAEDRETVTIERNRGVEAIEQHLASVFPSVEMEDERLYYGPLTAIRRHADGGLETGLDDRVTRGFSASM